MPNDNDSNETIIQLPNLVLERGKGNVVWLKFDQEDSNANILSKDMFVDLNMALDKLESVKPAALVITSNKSSGFIVGANIEEFSQVQNRGEILALIDRGQSTFNRIESLSFPTVALIHGFCLGGGYELALACDYRIINADHDARLGLPEVMLGIHPGFGGSARLIQLIGVLKAMPLMLAGRSIDAYRAKTMGMVDELLPQRNVPHAIEDILEKGKRERKRLRLDLILSFPLFRPFIAARLRKETAKRISKEHYPAPFSLIDLWQKNAGNLDQMLLGEGGSIASLFEHPTTKNLVKVFFMQQQLKKLGAGSKEQGITHVHVIGAGIMGGDIAAWCALQGMRVTLQDRETKYIAPAMKRASILFKKRIKDKAALQKVSDHLIADLPGHGVKHADVVIEAIVEELEAKVALFRSIEGVLKPGAILASNTSSIPLEAIAEKLENPKRLLGLHFFNPVAKMQLIEVIRSEYTEEKYFEKGMSFTVAISRLPLPVKSSPGFLVNRVLLPYLLEAVALLEEGIPPGVIDEAMLSFGMPVGPVALADSVGLDICLYVADILSGAYKVSVPELLREKVQQGDLGLKSGRGFYEYKEGKVIKAKPSVRSDDLSSEISDRLLLRLLNECVACLRENIVADETQLNAGMVFGTGFAPFRAGPMNYVKDQGVEEILGKYEYYQRKIGERFTADPGWKAIVESASKHDESAD